MPESRNVGHLVAGSRLWGVDHSESESVIDREWGCWWLVRLARGWRCWISSTCGWAALAISMIRFTDRIPSGSTAQVTDILLETWMYVLGRYRTPNPRKPWRLTTCRNVSVYRNTGRVLYFISAGWMGAAPPPHVTMNWKVHRHTVHSNF